MKTVSVILPTLNEKANLAKFVERILVLQSKLPNYKLELVIVDSHSTDGTKEVAEELVKKHRNVHFIEVGHGLGVAIIKGHQYALENLKPDVLAQLDADGQVDEAVLPLLIKAIDDGYTLALGSRFVEGGKNDLSASRRLFSWGSSVVCRILMGPWDVKEVTNSARAFTPELFKKINLKKLPWQEKSFIIQPAFLHEAVLAGAKYKEVPLVFRNRAEGYSKNKTFNYTYDIVTYAIDSRLNQLGIKLPFYRLSRRAKTFFKFGMVGVIGTLIDFGFYKLFINYFGFPPATSKGISSEIAIINNFMFNNYWTFKHRQTSTNVFQRFGIFNLVSLGGIAIAVLIVKFLHDIYGDASLNVLGREVAYNNFYFFATIPPVMIWNFTVNHFVTWRNGVVPVEVT